LILNFSLELLRDFAEMSLKIASCLVLYGGFALFSKKKTITMENIGLLAISAWAVA
jgi:hypothetical protein